MALPRLKNTLPLVAALALASCGPTAKTVPVHAVRGQVLYQGKPAAGAMVIFQPADGVLPAGVPIAPTGRTQADGSFQLTTYQENDGAPAGKYAVAILWPKSTREDEEEGNAAEESDRLQGRYADATKSPFRVEVKEGANELQPFQLK